MDPVTPDPPHAIHFSMRCALILALVGVLPGGQEPPGFDTGFHELSDTSSAGWNHRLGPDYATANPSASDRKKPPLLYLPPSKPCSFSRNNGGMASHNCGPPRQ